MDSGFPIAGFRHANCTKTCFYLSIILLASSGLYEIFQIGYIDIAGSLGIAYFAFTEGREAFEKAGSDSLACAAMGIARPVLRWLI